MTYDDINFYKRAKVAYTRKFQKSTYMFNRDYEKFKSLLPLDGNENIFEKYHNIDLNDGILYIIEFASSYYLNDAFNRSKLFFKSEEFFESLQKLTYGRFKKCANLSVIPYLENEKLILTRNFSIRGACSDLMPFGNFSEDSKCILKYIPTRYTVSEESLTHYINDLSARIWDLHQLIIAIFNVLKSNLETDDIIVQFININHLNEKFSAELSTGVFNNEIRKI